MADDEADVLALVGSTLLREGYDVLRAADGAEALSLARQKLPALAILDLSMPEMSGLEVCRVLKSDPLTSPISVVLLSARTGEVDRIVAFELGADDYVKKPFSPRELTTPAEAGAQILTDPGANISFRGQPEFCAPAGVTVIPLTASAVNAKCFNSFFIF